MQSLSERIPGGVWFPLTLSESILPLPPSVRVGRRVHEEDAADAAADAAAAVQASCCFEEDDEETLVSFYEVACLLSAALPFKDASWWAETTTTMCLRKLNLGGPQLVLSNFPGQLRLWSDEP